LSTNWETLSNTLNLSTHKLLFHHTIKMDNQNTAEQHLLVESLHGEHFVGQQVPDLWRVRGIAGWNIL
jgi:hypothetical protein